MTDKLTADDLRRLRHMLGADGRCPGFRNYYNAAPGGESEASMCRLVEHGFAEQFRTGYWCATAAGMDAVGLSPAAKRLALEN